MSLLLRHRGFAPQDHPALGRKRPIPGPDPRPRGKWAKRARRCSRAARQSLAPDPRPRGEWAKRARRCSGAAGQSLAPGPRSPAPGRV